MNNNQSNPKFIGVFTSILGILSSLIAIIPFSLAYITGYTWYYILGITLIIIVISLVKHRRYVSKSILKFIVRLTCPDKAYKLNEKIITFEYLSRNKMQHKRLFKVTVLHDGFTEIIDKYKWTGSQNLTPNALFDDQVLEKLDKKIGMQRYAIRFKNAQRYNKNDIVPEMGMKITDMVDDKNESSPHLSSGIFEITDLLILHVIFDNNLNPKNIRKLEYLNYSDDDHYSCETTEYTYNNKTNKKEVIWKIRNPIYGGKYMIDWDFD